MNTTKPSRLSEPLCWGRAAAHAAGRARIPREARNFAVGLALVLCSVVVAANDFPPPTQASQAAGRPGLPLQALIQVDCPNFAKLAGQYQSQFQAPMRHWAIEHLGRLGIRKVLYPFSGPDVITAMTLFGAADHLILVADQMPELNVFAQVEAQRVQKECQTQSYFARLGYFRTNDLEGKGSIRPRFTKMLVYSILISGGSIERVVPLRIGSQGKLEEIHPYKSGAPHDGLRFEVTRVDGRPLMVDYLRINLANPGIRAESVQHRFLADHMHAAVFIKSASHLLQKSSFSVLADLIANKASVVVQDETGLDIGPLRQHFRVSAFGRFNQPHPLWKDSPSGLRLKEFLSAQPLLPQLPFVLGYEKPMGSILLVASRPPSRPGQ